MYRLNALTLAIPPLRERKDEIEALVTTFLAQMSREHRPGPTGHRERRGHGVPQARIRWPGNIRELKNVVERAVVLCDGPSIRPEHLPLEKMRPGPGNYVTVDGARATPNAAFKNLPTLDDPKALAERQKILDALEACAFNQTRAATKLGISRRTLVSRLDQFGIPRPQKGHDDEDLDGPTAAQIALKPMA